MQWRREADGSRECIVDVWDDAQAGGAVSGRG